VKERLVFIEDIFPGREVRQAGRPGQTGGVLAPSSPRLMCPLSQSAEPLIS